MGVLVNRYADGHVALLLGLIGKLFKHPINFCDMFLFNMYTQVVNNLFETLYYNHTIIFSSDYMYLEEYPSLFIH